MMILFRAIDAIDTPLLSHYAIDYFTFRHYAIIDDYFRCHYFITPLLLRLISLLLMHYFHYYDFHYAIDAIDYISHY
jgi:hypothetical protein